MRSEAQKKADAKYQLKQKKLGNKSKFCALMPKDEFIALNKLLKNLGLSKPEFVRKAYTQMQIEFNRKNGGNNV